MRRNIEINVSGIILAAGFSSRMKTTKALLKISGKTFLENIFSKLNVGSRTEAVITGLRAGFLSIDDIQ